MALVLSALLAGLLAGRGLRPRRCRHLASADVQFVAMVVGGLAASIVADLFRGTPALLLGFGGRAALLAAALGNLHLAGTGVLAIGLAANVLPMALNRGVSVRPGALVAAGVVSAEDVADVSLHGPRHLEGDEDLLPVLGDALPIEPLGVVVSFGDLIVTVGLADVVANASRRRRRMSASAEVLWEVEVGGDIDLTAQRGAHAEETSGFGDLVHAQDGSAEFDTLADGGERAGRPLGRWRPGQGADEVFA